MLGRLVMMPSSLQVLDHHLFISKIISGVRQFHHWPKRGEESWTNIVKMLPTQKKEQPLANIEVVGEERRRVVEVVGLGQTNQLLSAKKQQLWSHY